MGRSSVLDLADDETSARASREIGLRFKGTFGSRQGNKSPLSHSSPG